MPTQWADFEEVAPPTSNNWQDFEAVPEPQHTEDWQNFEPVAQTQGQNLPENGGNAEPVSTWDLINRPLLHAPQNVHDTFQWASAKDNPFTDKLKAPAGAAEGVVDAAEGFTSPLGIATLGTARLIAKAPAMLRGLLGAAFAAMGVKQAGNAGVEFNDALKNKDYGRASKAAVDILGGAAQVGIGGHEFAGGVKKGVNSIRGSEISSEATPTPEVQPAQQPPPEAGATPQPAPVSQNTPSIISSRKNLNSKQIAILMNEPPAVQRVFLELVGENDPVGGQAGFENALNRARVAVNGLPVEPNNTKPNNVRPIVPPHVQNQNNQVDKNGVPIIGNPKEISPMVDPDLALPVGEQTPKPIQTVGEAVGQKLDEIKALLAKQESPAPEPLTTENFEAVPPEYVHGGAQENLSAEQQAISQANNAPAAWGDFAKAVEAQKEAPPEPIVDQSVNNISEGPGAASPGDVPNEPPMARASNSAESEQPHAIVTPSAPFLSGMAKALHNGGAELKGIAGDSMPRTTAAMREAGEAGVRYASSRIAAHPMADVFASHTLEGTNVDPFKFGVALSEDNLRSVRENFRQQATQLRAEGKIEESEAATRAGDKVTSLVGEEGSPFKDEDEYQDFLKDSETKKAIAQHKQQWNEVVEPMYKDAQSLDPDTELASRGLQTGARINLKAVFPEDESPASKPVGSGTGGSLTATFKRKSPFGIKAKGTGTVYEGDYSSIIKNTFEKQLELANKNAFDRKLVESGLAVIDKPGQRIVIGDNAAVPFPLSRRLITTAKDGKSQTFPAGQNIYVRHDLAGEYRRAAGVDPRFNIPVITPAVNFLNKTALAGLTDLTVHMSNQATALLNRPASGPLLRDSFMSAFGRSDVPIAMVKTLIKSLKDNRAQIAELAEIGALRQEHIGSAGPLGMSGRLLSKTDKVTRLMLDDTFKQLAKDGLVPNTETARREYVNQIGQYNRRLQGPFMTFLRDSGVGPFATAGRTFNTMAVKMATMSPAVKATSNMAALALRANVISKWVGGAVLLGTINYLLTYNKGGGMMGRPGTPIGKIDTGQNDKNGRPLLIPAADIIGLGRALRVTGVGSAINSKRLGLTNADAFDSGFRDVFNSAIGPMAGPAVRFGMTAATGYPAAINVGRSAPVAKPGQNQVAVNVKEALQQANPIIGTYFDKAHGKSMPEVLAHQLPRFTMAPGKPPEMVANYPKIVGLAQTHAYADYVVGAARKLEPEARAEFIKSALEGLDAEQRDMVIDSLKRRKVSTDEKKITVPKAKMARVAK